MGDLVATLETLVAGDSKGPQLGGDLLDFGVVSLAKMCSQHRLTAKNKMALWTAVEVAVLEGLLVVTAGDDGEDSGGGT